LKKDLKNKKGGNKLTQGLISDDVMLQKTFWYFLFMCKFQDVQNQQVFQKEK